MLFMRRRGKLSRSHQTSGNEIELHLRHQILNNVNTIDHRVILPKWNELQINI